MENCRGSAQLLVRSSAVASGCRRAGGSRWRSVSGRWPLATPGPALAGVSLAEMQKQPRFYVLKGAGIIRAPGIASGTSTGS